MYKDIETYYRLHSKIYDATRWSFLFGRKGLFHELPKLAPNAHILDLGCGTGIHLPLLQKKYPDAKITALDCSYQMISIAEKKAGKSIQFIHKGYNKDCFEAASFDLILCSYSLTMMSQTDMVIKSIEQHLKPNGILVVVDFDTTPFTWFSKWMKKNYVFFEPNLFRLLKDSFRVTPLCTREAWFGLYSYSIFLGKNRVIANEVKQSFGDCHGRASQTPSQ